MVRHAETEARLPLAKQASSTRLSDTEQGLLRSADIGRSDRVLDVCVDQGALLEAIYRQGSCEVCGCSSQLGGVRVARERLKNADIVYAAPDDIPWLADSFDWLFCKSLESVDMSRLREFSRVLKPQGHVLIGVNLLSAPFRMVAELLGETQISRSRLTERLTDAGFENIIWKRISVAQSIITARKEAVAS